MSPHPPDLFSKKLIIQSGKGGTGKTTTSAAIACLLAEQGRRVLLVEVDTRDRFAPLFGRREPVGYEIAELRPGVHGLNLDPQLVIVDFFKMHLRVKALYRQIVDSRIFQYFYAAAPGLRELICLGKIWRLLGETKRGRPIWDVIVLDAPATGHGLAILNIAQAAYDTLFGPMKRHALEIRDMLRDPDTTLLNLCAIPEEMPVTEAEDLFRSVKDDLEMQTGVLLMNARMPERLPNGARARLAKATDPELASATRAIPWADAQALRRAAALRGAYGDLATYYVDEARRRIPLPMIEVPFLFDADYDERTLERVTDAIRDGLEALAPAGALP